MTLHPSMGHVSFENLIKFTFTLPRKIHIYSRTHILHKTSGDSQTLQKSVLGFCVGLMTLTSSVREETVLASHLNWSLAGGVKAEGSLS